MSLTLRGSIWWCEWRIGGARVRESTGSSDRAAAQEYHDTRRAELWREHRLGEQRRVHWDEAALAWVESHAKHKKSFSDDIYRLRRIQPLLTGRELVAIDKPLLVAIRDGLISDGLAAGTANRHLALVSAVMHHAHADGKIPGVPKIPYLKEAAGRTRWLTREQAVALLGELPEHLAMMALLTLATGLRRSNVTGLGWANVDLARRCAWVWGDEAKTGKPIAVPLNDDAIRVLRAQRGKHPRWVFVYRGKPVMRTKTKAWDAAVARAGIDPGFRWHDLRHTWASWHSMSKTPRQVLRELGGWSSDKMLDRYAHLDPGYLAQYAQNVGGVPHVLPTVEAGDSASDALQVVEFVGVADGVRTHDNRNHKTTPLMGATLDQWLALGNATKRRLKTG